MEDEKLTASEALYGFCALLIDDKEAKGEIVTDLMERFVEANQLGEPREGYHDLLVFPKES